MALINVSQQNTFEEWRVKTNEIGTLVGDGSLLTTTADTLVDAVNEIRSGVIEGTISITGSVFRVQVDSADTYELTLNDAGDLAVTGIISAAGFSGPLTGDVTGNSSSTTKLVTARTIAATGDASWSVTFDGTGNVSSALTLVNTGVTAGTYSKLTVDAKGRVTSATNITSSDITQTLGYTPWHSGNDGVGSGLDADLLDGYNSSASATANTIALRDSSGNLSANVFSGTATAARYADLAEKYSTDKEYNVGTVMVVAFGGDAECTQSFAPGQLAIGVISENPAYLMNKDADGQAIALKGRVPVRIVGPISKGQPIMASVDGLAIVGSINPIGVALETNLEVTEKLVECVIL
jgi:hypothetical protein